MSGKTSKDILVNAEFGSKVYFEKNCAIWGIIVETCVLPNPYNSDFTLNRTLIRLRSGAKFYKTTLLPLQTEVPVID